VHFSNKLFKTAQP